MPFNKTVFIFMLLALGYSNNHMHGMKRSFEQSNQNNVIHPLLLATYINDIEMVQHELTKISTDPESDRIKAKALLIASLKGHTGAAKALLDDKANVNVANSHGMSALMLACANGYTTTVKLLLNDNADINLVNIHNKDAIMIAEENSHDPVVELLLEHNASSTILALTEQAKHQPIVIPAIIELTEKEKNKRTTTEKPHICTYSKCGLSYTTKKSLQRHIRNKHSKNS